MNKAVFLDRDGTISHEVGYVDRIEKFSLYPFTPEALKIFRDLGYLLVVVTNQSGVARGFFTEDLLRKVHERMLVELEREGVSIDAIFYCPHHPSVNGVCRCRKPGTGMIDEAVKRFNIDPKRSIVIGDKWSDVELGRRVGAFTIQVLTGYGKGEFLRGEIEKNPPDMLAKNILHAAIEIKGKTVS